MNSIKTQKAKATAVTFVMIAAAFTCAFYVTTDNEDYVEDVEAIVPLIIAFVIGMFIGAIVWELYGKTQGSQDQADAYTRQIEAAKVAESILMASADFRNALNNYINIWRFTNEHFIRTAEIMSASLWSADATYHPTDVLLPAGVYANSSFMMSNAATQISHFFFAKMNERMTLWNADPVYQDMMSLEWRYGSQKISTKSDFAGWLKTAAKITTESKDKVFISGGDFWVFGGSASIKSASGTVYTLMEGLNNLDSISTFRPDVYELQTGREYAGDMLYVIDVEAADITSGMVMMAGNTVKLAKLFGNYIEVDGSQYNNLSVGVVPDGAPSPSPVVIHDVSNPAQSVLVKYRDMHTTVNQTIVAANSAASTVWNIFNKAGESSMFLTTLMVPNYFENIQINQAQQELVTTLSMIQLADFTQNNIGKITADDFQLSGGSFQLFMRGDLLDANGNKLFQDVIFTPFYFVNDETLTIGNNSVDQPAIVSVWDTNVTNQTLSSWSFTSSTSVATLVPMTGGESMFVYEILYDGQFKNSVFLDVKQIELISAEDWPIYIPPRFVVGDKDIIVLLAMLLILIGALAVLTVFLHKRLIVVLGGVVCIVIGAVILAFRDSWLGGLL